MEEQTEEAESNSCRTVWDSSRMALVSSRIQQNDSHSTLGGSAIGVLMMRKNGHTPPVWRLTAVAVPLIHRGRRVRRARAKAGETRWHNKKGSRKSAEQLEKERKLLAPTSLTPRKTGAGDVISSFSDFFCALARTPSASSCQRRFQLKLRQSCNFETNSQRGSPACYLLPAWF